MWDLAASISSWGARMWFINFKNNVFFRYNSNPFQEFRAIVFG
jgi:hypothetical protein